MKKIAVHSGNFHADDCLAVYLLLHTEQFSNSEIVRTRDQEIINSCDAVVDVGSIYDHKLHRYDHHQTSFTEKFPGSTVPMASSGLVYLHYGSEVILNLSQKLNLEFEKEYLDFVFNYLYFHFVQEIDAQDNGINPSTEKPNYSISTDITHRISRINPHWKMEKTDDNSAFMEAVSAIGKDFEFFLTYATKCAISNYIITKKAFENRLKFDPSGQILNIPSYFPINDYLDLLEGNDKKLLFLLYEKNSDGNTSWTVRTITTNKPFESRKPLPFPGVNAQEMKEKTGIDGLIFAHKSPFLAVFRTKEQALQYAHFTANYK